MGFWSITILHCRETANSSRAKSFPGTSGICTSSVRVGGHRNSHEARGAPVAAAKLPESRGQSISAPRILRWAARWLRQNSEGRFRYAWLPGARSPVLVKTAMCAPLFHNYRTLAGVYHSRRHMSRVAAICYRAGVDTLVIMLLNDLWSYLVGQLAIVYLVQGDLI